MLTIKKIKEKYNSEHLPYIIIKDYVYYTPVAVFFLVLYIFSDLKVLHYPSFAVTRIVLIILFLVMLFIRLKGYKKYISIVGVFNTLTAMAFVFMGFFVLLRSFNDPLVFRAAISGLIVDVFAAFFLVKGMKSILITFLIPFFIAACYMAIIIRPEFGQIRELLNPMAIYVGAIVLALTSEKSRFSEFFYKTSLESEKEKTEELYIETASQNNELQYQKEEILSMNEQLEQRKEEMQINLEVISELNKQLRQKNKAITASINYARRIQDAILPTDESMRKVLKDYFILYKPCNIVSGDFYWMHTSETYDVIAAVDCTGHGVPGGFMSMLGYSLLNEVVQNSHIASANEILNKLKEKLKVSLNQVSSNETQADGLDIALCLINRTTNTVQFSGAYMPLTVIRNNELIHIKGDKMPIGRYIKEIPSFTNHELQINDGDKFYLYSDGFQDQMGGDENKRFLSMNLKNLLVDIRDLPFENQKKILDSTIEEWKGKNEQMDDIMVIGFQL